MCTLNLERVSVIIPCYNDGAYIEEAIASVRAQTYGNIEIIICDDGSTDAQTLTILDDCKRQGLRVLHLTNNGPAAARNRGIAASSGKYILPLDADDRIEKTYIEKAVRVIESDDAIGVVYCYANLFGLNSGRWKLPDYSLEAMLADNIVFVTALFRQEDWVRLGGFCESFHNGIEDYDFWLSILELDKRIVQIPEVLFCYRIKQMSRTMRFINDAQGLYEAYDCVYDRHKALYHKHMDIAFKAVRRSLLTRMVHDRQMENAYRIQEWLNRFPRMKRILKFIYYNFFARSKS